MLSYRHIFHAGNHADLLKHCVLHAVLAYMKRKEKPFIYIDTHAGAGLYPLADPRAQQNLEFTSGWDKLRTTETLPPTMAAFRDALLPFTSRDIYPGSPLLAASMLRPMDFLYAFERHPRDFAELAVNLKNTKVRHRVSARDGLAGAIGQLPPPNRRAVVLIDPSYEEKSDYRNVPQALLKMQARCPEAVLMLWYPLLARPEACAMVEKLPTLFPHFLRVTLTVGEKRPLGMYGSAVFILNAPWTLSETLKNSTLGALLTGSDAALDLSTH